MRYNWVLYVALTCVMGCGSAKQPSGMAACTADSTLIYVRRAGVERITQLSQKQFTRTFDKFYVDSANNFYIRTAMLQESCGHTSLSDMMVEMPRLDAATVRREGDYFIDKDKVVCVFENSDGGNYEELRGVDPGSFKVFRNVFGGRDKDHVFSHAAMLDGVDPRRVKVYSDMANCSNCIGYFKDGVSMYYGDRRVDGEAIPGDYKFVE